MFSLTSLFPFFTLGALAAGLLVPELFQPLKPWILPALALVMFAMGTTLTGDDFLRAAKRPRVVALGVGLQFLLMPLLGWLLASLFALPPELAAGVVLVGAAPGGTASNVITFLAKGDTALSITITGVATLLAFVATPFLTWLYIGQTVEVPFFQMAYTVLTVVFLPVAAGVVAARFLGERKQRLLPWMPGISMAGILLIIAVVVALNGEKLGQIGAAVALVVMLHNLLGFAGADPGHRGGDAELGAGGGAGPQIFRGPGSAARSALQRVAQPGRAGFRRPSGPAKRALIFSRVHTGSFRGL